MPFSDSILGSFPYRMLGEIDQPTNAQGMQNAQFGGSPQALQQLLMSPGMQHQMQQFGMDGYDGSQIRQSPFFPNPFMQHHPQFGGMLTGMMANAAATPEAPMISGAGSGISRAMQGMMGGPEMLRQYQVKQMMAPFGLQGAMMPAREMERKESMLQTLQDAISGQQDIKNRQLEQAYQSELDKMQMKSQDEQNKLAIAGMRPPVQGPRGVTYPGTPQMGAVLPGGSVGSQSLIGPMFANQQQRPHFGTNPATPGQFVPYDQQMLGQQEEAKEKPKRQTKFGVEDKKQAGANERSRAGITSREKIAGGREAARSAGDQLRQLQSQYQIDLKATGGDQDKIQKVQQQYEGPGGLFEQLKNKTPRGYASPEAPGTGGPGSQQGPPPEASHTFKGRPIGYNGKDWVYTDQQGGIAQ